MEKQLLILKKLISVDFAWQRALSFSIILVFLELEVSICELPNSHGGLYNAP